MRAVGRVGVALLSMCAGCTPENLDTRLWAAKDPRSLHAESLLARNEAAVDAARRGDYDRALALLPTREELDKRARPGDERAAGAVEQNRATLAYLRLRKAFAGAFVAPDTWVAYRGSLQRTSGDLERADVMTNALDAELAGVGLSVPVMTAWRAGESETVYGDTLLRFTYYAGKASVWPDTKLAFGVRSYLPTGPHRYRSGSMLNPFARVGHVFGPVAVTAATSSQLFGYQGGTGFEQSLAFRAHLLLHTRLMPIVGTSGAMRFGAGRTGDATVAFLTGVRVFLDAFDRWQLEVSVSTGVADEFQATRFGQAAVWLSWRW